MPESRCAEDSSWNCTIWYKLYNNHSWRVRLQVRGALEYSRRHGQYSQYLQTLHILIEWFGSILKTTIHSSGYSWILFHNFRSNQEHWWNSLAAPQSTLLCIQLIWEHLGASGMIRVAVQSCWVVRLWLPNHCTFCWCSRNLKAAYFDLRDCLELCYPLDCNLGIRNPFGHGNRFPHCKYFAMQPQLCQGGLGVLWTDFLMSSEHFDKNYRLYRNGVPIKRAVFVGRVVSRSATQKLENVTAQPRWTTLPINPQNILQA